MYILVYDTKSTNNQRKKQINKTSSKSKNFIYQRTLSWNSLVVQWLELAPHCQGLGSIPGLGTKVLQAVWCSQKGREKNTVKIEEITHRMGEKIFVSRISDRNISDRNI